ncbi:hypothetical protein Ahy_B08g091681 [Arachis hypogaea]|uniref:Uncharacterized protein n=1 Tax=Arachis hypogaea TaxID=3818 RepID=A0A444Y2L5_ARAHY|nr:hypothetical protein Ahy_B08g091681 [Arachis hypogaea]
MGWWLQQILDDVCHGQDQQMGWLRPEVKKALLVHWETDAGFRHHHLTNKANKASARLSKYTGGSTVFMKTKSRLSKLLDCKDTLAKTFKYTHTLKRNKARFVDQRSRAIISLCTSTLKPSSGSTTSRAVQSDKGVDLRLQVQELQHSLHQEEQELNNYWERY